MQKDIREITNPYRACLIATILGGLGGIYLDQNVFWDGCLYGFAVGGLGSMGLDVAISTMRSLKERLKSAKSERRFYRTPEGKKRLKEEWQRYSHTVSIFNRLGSNFQDEFGGAMEQGAAKKKWGPTFPSDKRIIKKALANFSKHPTSSHRQK